MSWDIEGVLKLNFLEKYKKIKSKEKLDKFLSIFGDAERAHDKEIKFLCFYKVLNEFGEKTHGDVDKWLECIFSLDKNEPRERKDSGKIVRRTRPTALRDAIMYDESPNITEEDLKNMKIYAQRYIQEEFKL